MTDKTPLKIIAAIVLPILFAVIWRFSVPANGGKESETNDSDTKELEVSVLSTWTMPSELLEISGIDWLDSARVVCVEDESGVIFVYNLGENNIEERIQFAGKGDYEGIAVNGATAYVLRADGVIFEVANFETGKPKVSTFKTFLTEKQDCESLSFDPSTNRLLVAVKADDPHSETHKGIYAFDLASKIMGHTPVFRIDLAHEIFDILDEEKPEDRIRPSDIAIHPATGDIYVLEGTKPKLLLIDKRGQILRLVDLKKSIFPQPEGITFSPDGQLFISSEGKDGFGSISLVELR